MRALLLSLSLFIIGLTQAQLRYGGAFSGGMSYHSAKSDFSDGSKVYRFISPISYGLSGIVEYEIKEGLIAQSGLGFTVKGMSYSYDKGTDSTYQTLWKVMNKKMVYNTFYLRVPTTIRYYNDLFKDPNNTPFIQGGLVTDVNIFKSGPKGNGIDQTIDFDYHKMIDVNFTLGVGLRFETRDLHELSLSLDFYKGLLNSTTSDYGEAKDKIKIRNNQLLVTLGYTVSKTETADPTFDF